MEQRLVYSTGGLEHLEVQAGVERKSQVGDGVFSAGAADFLSKRFVQFVFVPWVLVKYSTRASRSPSETFAPLPLMSVTISRHLSWEYLAA
jgi:hypothetical protein